MARSTSDEYDLQSVYFVKRECSNALHHTPLPHSLAHTSSGTFQRDVGLEPPCE